MIPGPNKPLNAERFKQAKKEVTYKAPHTSQEALAVSFQMNKNYLCHFVDTKTHFRHLHNAHIAADDGSSAMEPHEKIMQKAQSLFSPANELFDHIINYSAHCLDNEYTINLSTYLKSIGIIDEQASIYPNPYDDTIKYPQNTLFPAIGHGTSQLFSGFISSLNHQQDDVVLEFTPSYGLFNNILHNKKITVETIDLFNPKTHQVDLERLKELIVLIQTEINYKFFSYLSIQIELNCLLIPYGANQQDVDLLNNIIRGFLLNHPHPTSIDNYNTLLNKKISELVDQVMLNPSTSTTMKSLRINSIYAIHEKLKLRQKPSIKAIYNINPLMPYGAVLDQEQINGIAKVVAELSPETIIIDDLSYYNLVLPDTNIKVGTFAKSPLQHNTLSLLGFSKDWSMAGLRSGIAIGDMHIIKPILGHINDEVTMPSIITKEVANAVFCLSKKERNKYLTVSQNYYYIQRDLAIALAIGIQHIKNPEHHKKVEDLLKKEKLSPQTIEQLLKGINHLNIICTPESGYFLCLDFENFIGTQIGNEVIETAQDVRTAIYCYTDINTISSEMCNSFSKPFLRFSYSIPATDIIEAFIRLHLFLHTIAPEKVAQLELHPSKTKANPSTKKRKEIDISSETKAITHAFDKDKDTPKEIISEKSKGISREIEFQNIEKGIGSEALGRGKRRKVECKYSSS